MELFYSRQFQDREEGLARLTSILKGEAFDYSIDVNKIARSATLLLHRAVRDAVFSVFNHAAETVRALFIDFVPNRVTPNEVARCVDRLLPELLAKSGDPSPRIHTLAQHTILCIAACPEVRLVKKIKYSSYFAQYSTDVILHCLFRMQHLIAPAVSRPVGSGTHPRLALSRMQMAEQLVLSQGISSDKQSGLTCRILSECGCSGIHHPAEPVRKVAERVLLLVYKVNPRLVRKQLPPDDDITRRNLLYRQLFTEFDKLDDERRKQMIASNQYPPVGILRNISSHRSPPFSPNMASMSTSQRDSINSDSDHRKFSFNNGTNTNSADSTTVNSPRKTVAYNYSPTKSASETCEPESQTQNSSKSNSESENRCSFCDWTYNGDAEQLDKHYWKACPILTKCPQCSQVLEVAALGTHLIGM